tara:strand:+ start:3229 stop:3510 length:282 start_codon:yes stop_codon:yes gene_type:complete
MTSFSSNNNRTFKFIFLVLFFGVIAGTAISMFLGFVLPDGVVKDFFLMYQELGWQRTTLNLGVIKITTGFLFSISVCSLIGLFMSWYFLRYFR